MFEMFILYCYNYVFYSRVIILKRNFEYNNIIRIECFENNYFYLCCFYRKTSVFDWGRVEEFY